MKMDNWAIFDICVRVFLVLVAVLLLWVAINPWATINQKPTDQKPKEEYSLSLSAKPTLVIVNNRWMIKVVEFEETYYASGERIFRVYGDIEDRHKGEPEPDVVGVGPQYEDAINEAVEAGEEP